jgi:hypothetical protein
MDRFSYKSQYEKNPLIPKIMGSETDESLIYYISRAYDNLDTSPHQKNAFLYDALKFIIFGKFSKQPVYLNKNIAERLFFLAKGMGGTHMELTHTPKQIDMIYHSIKEMLDIISLSYKQHQSADASGIGSPN